MKLARLVENPSLVVNAPGPVITTVTNDFVEVAGGWRSVSPRVVVTIVTWIFGGLGGLLLECIIFFLELEVFNLESMKLLVFGRFFPFTRLDQFVILSLNLLHECVG